MHQAPPARASTLRPSSALAGNSRAWAPSAIALCVLSAGAQAQLVFSLDYKGASKGTVDGAGTVLIRESDVLAPTGGPAFGPLLPPTVFRGPQQVGMPSAVVCTTAAGFPCGAELDALSFGNEKLFDLNPNPNLRARLFFSVDYQGQGTPPAPAAPNDLFTEALALDVASDIYTVRSLPLLGLPPIAATPVVALVIDGNGLASVGGSARRRGLGLLEPHIRFLPPQPATPPYLNPGDDLDALQLPQPPTSPPVGIFFSVDGLIIDPRNGIRGSNTAGTITPNRPPGSVLFVPFGGAVTAQEYATATELGLDPALDDLDALILRENGLPGFQKSTALYDWLPSTPGGAHDMLLFSVRSGSQIVGTPDSILGLPIEPGDLLIAPFLGLAATSPGIVIPAEDLGLRTMRAGYVEADDFDGGGSGEVCYDCNGNGIEDAVDISTGSSADVNGNGIPDECENSYTADCTCPSSAPPPCGNDDAGAGCKNSTGVGGLLAAVGTTSVTTDDLVLNATQLPPPATGIWLRSSASQPAAALKDGLLCLGSPLLRFGQTGPGAASKGPGMVAQAAAGANPMNAGSTWHFQYYYRNVSGPCLFGANITNRVSVTWTP